MKALVLGANGYLGSKITTRLVEEGHYVVCTKRDNSKLFRLESINDKIIWIPSSIYAVDAATRYDSFDFVINMACNYGRDNFLYDNVIEANIEFPLKVLNKTIERGTKKFFTIGTGLPDDFNMYSFSKKQFNEFGKFYVEKHNIDFCCLKLEMFYGVDEPCDRFLPALINKMIKGVDVDTTIGTQRRDIIAVEDIIKGIEMILGADLKGYNEISVGTGEAPALMEIIDYIWELTGKKSKVNKGAVPMRKNEPDCIADTTAISSIGEWKPLHWRVGIGRMVEKLGEYYENIN